MRAAAASNSELGFEIQSHGEKRCPDTILLLFLSVLKKAVVVLKSAEVNYGAMFCTCVY